jgi:hypothetical protein
VARAVLNWDASKLSLVYLMGRLMTVYIGDGLCWFMTVSYILHGIYIYKYHIQIPPKGLV